jgi:hypothetical protein
MKTQLISKVNVEAGRIACLLADRFDPSTARIISVLFTLALALVLLIPAHLQSKAQAIVPEYIPLNAAQLDQLVAPIALDPDPLVAQILIGSTFPDQVTDASNWLASNVNLSPDQRATQANGMSWDPSIKGLVIFPVVLDSMAKNNAWTVQLGNAYYNQPDDVMNAIQALRSEAIQSQILVSVPQENVVVSEDLIEIEPVDPNAVFIQYYNPWVVFGTLVDTYPGFTVEPVPAGLVVADGVSFEPAVSVGLDAHFGFSFGGWAPGWGNGAVVYNNNVYNSNSRSVANRGHFGGRDCNAFEHGGRGVPAGFHPGSRGAFGGRGSMGRPMPRRISGPAPATRSGQRNSGRTTPLSRSYSGARSGSLNRPSARSTSASHSMSARPSSADHFNRSSAGAHPNTTSARNNSPSRNAVANHSISGRQSLTGSRGMNQAATANHSLGSNRALSQNRPTGRQMNRPVSATNNFAGSRSSTPSNSFGSNRATSRPAANSLGIGQAMNRPTAANNSFGANRPMARPAAMNHSGGFGGGSIRGGHKR